MSSSEDDLLLAAASFTIMKTLINQKSKANRKRHCWMKSLFKNRELYSGNIVLNDLQKDDGDHFKNCCRMSPETFNQLFILVESKIQKEDTKFRKSIPANQRLGLTLRYLATGDSFASLSLIFRISKSSISYIIPEVCAAIIEVLQDYIQVICSNISIK